MQPTSGGRIWPIAMRVRARCKVCIKKENLLNFIAINEAKMSVYEYESRVVLRVASFCECFERAPSAA